MKRSLLIGALVASLAAPVLAQHGHHGHHHHGGSGNWVAPLIIGGVLGAVITSQNRPPVVQQPPIIYTPPVYYPPLQTCREVLTIQIDPYGREYRYPQTVCGY